MRISDWSSDVCSSDLAHFMPGIYELVAATIGQEGSWYLQFALATIVLFGPGLRFFQHGVPALLRGAPDMNSLVALGTGAAWGYSVVATFAPGILPAGTANRSEEPPSQLQPLIPIS